jgi:hypothetical protein
LTHTNKNIVKIALLITILALATQRAPFVSKSSANTTETVVKAEPGLIELGNSAGDPISIPGTQFNVTVKICNVTNLYGFDLKFRWNTTYLKYVSHSVCIPIDTYSDGILWNPVLPLADEVNATTGTYWVASSSMSPAPSFNGTGTVFTMTFEVLKQPYDFETGTPGVDPIDIILDFVSTDLASRVSEPPEVSIEHTVEPAVVRIWEKTFELPAYPVLKILPTKINNVPEGSVFNIDIWILGVNEQYNIESFNITVNFNSTLLGATNVTEGYWLKSYAENTTETTKQIDNANGTVTYALEQVPPTYPPPTAGGTLFSVAFNVIYGSPLFPPPSCDITLEPTEILDRNMGLVQHTIENCTYIAFRPPPIARFSWTPAGYVLPLGQVMTFNASESYPPVGLKSYEWNFGDGNITNLPTPIITHIYATPGIKLVVLNVTDYGDSWNIASVTLYVIETQTAPEISVVNLLTENNEFTFYANTTSVGSRFNATVWAYNVANLYAYQVHLVYNSTLLRVARAWLPTQDQQWVFYGKASLGLSPTFGMDYILIGDSVMEANQAFGGTGILGIIEFEIIYPSTTEGAKCDLDINNSDTVFLDPNAHEIASTRMNGRYDYVGTESGKIVSTISITISPSSIHLGETITVSGVIVPPRASVNVTIYANGTQIGTVQTGFDGRYNYTWMPADVGNYEIKVGWFGDETTDPAESQLELLTVETSTTGIVQYVAMGIAAFAIAVTAVYFIRKRKHG